MTVLIDRTDPKRPKVLGMYPATEEGITEFLRYTSGIADDFDAEEYKTCYTLLRKNNYVSGGDYCLQKF